MYFIGIDLSLNATGFIIINQDREIIIEEIITSKVKDEIEVRLIHIRNTISKLIEKYPPIKICLEGLSFQSSSSSMFQIAGLNFIIRLCLYENSFNFESVPPTKLKKFVSGKGNCKKSLMLKEVYKRWGYDTNDDNLADAYGLANMALESYNEKK